MKVLILGTSNSILNNGWSFGLRNALAGHDVISMCVGASPGIQFSDKMSLNFKNYDYVFFDSIPNDEEYARNAKGYAFNEKNEKIMEEIYSTISSQTNLVILGFCNRWAFLEESMVYKSRKNIAQAIGCQFVDIKTLLKVHLNEKSVNSLYESHQAHPKRELSYEIGVVIGNEILNHFNQFNHDCHDYSANFTVQTAHQFSENVIRLENSLLSMDVVEVHDDASLEIDSTQSCLGVYINAYATNCILSYADDYSLQNDVRLTYNQNHEDGKFLKVFVPFHSAPKITKLSLINKAGGPNIYHPVMTHDHKELSHRMQLSSVLYWDGDVASETHNATHKINSLSLSHTIAHKLLEKKTQSKIKNKSISGIKTHHNSYILFDRNKNHAIHGSMSIVSDSVVPVVLVRLGDSYATAIAYKHGLEVIDIFEGSNISLLTEQDKITFSKDGKFLCAEKYGALTFSRSKAMEWECFTPTQ